MESNLHYGLGPACGTDSGHIMEQSLLHIHLLCQSNQKCLDPHVRPAWHRISGQPTMNMEQEREINFVNLEVVQYSNLPKAILNDT